MPKVEDFLSSEDQAAVIGAIRISEKNTSGEIRVHLESHSNPPNTKINEQKDAIDRAEEVFNMLDMQNTKESNGVLIYVAVEDRTLVIMGDKGINDKVGQDFWESTKDIMINHFKNGEIKLGLVNGILKAGEQLKKHFPHQKDDKNELPDDISVG
ncbi:TPM domain-containing protein [Aequorivita viscosa]|uniref:TLP18.3, Psb32 and MOLO-1 founding protein of phosphatase n=1 Tax=Aequorivita viscosa TaxID=797419 RepID=A0A1M6CK22_9FLAO|nr:TPM domain-containing protein [Aequorivita viscosa]SDW38041.1 TLP18.3, Psb32 and MOLO-1 founding protein of phosphatase [Aequorivita viscosa]SHI61370.1 TLP18.3, Psb32 and MOLO-1 founding protein of phosphatase [Aequorivita viscosa]